MTEITPVNPILGRIVYEQIIHIQRALDHGQNLHTFEVLLPPDLAKPFLRHVSALPGVWNAATSCMIGHNGAYLKVIPIPAEGIGYLPSMDRYTGSLLFCIPNGIVSFELDSSSINNKLKQLDYALSGLSETPIEIYETIEEPETPAALDSASTAEPDAQESPESGEGAAQAPAVVQGSGLPAGGTDAAPESVPGSAPAAKTISGSST